MYGQDILRGISKVPFEIPRKISYPYNWKIQFLYNIEISRTLDLIARKHLKLVILGPVDDLTPDTAMSTAGKMRTTALGIRFFQSSIVSADYPVPSARPSASTSSSGPTQYKKINILPVYKFPS